MSELWSGAEAAAATGGRLRGDFSATGVSIDTRSIRAGDMFVALKDQRDGHDFVADAFARGAAAALVSRVPAGLDAACPLLLVGDVLTGLGALARAARGRARTKVVAVTGSAGKTSTKEMLHDILAGQGRTHAAQASFNNHLGVPLTLARMPRDAEFGVIEIGTGNPGEIAPLATLAAPDVALITTVSAAHLVAFADVAAIADEKSAIFGGLAPGGVAVINGDLSVTPQLRDAARHHGARVVTFGATQGCTYRAISVTQHAEATVVQCETPQGPLLFKIGAAGRHFAMNGLGALAAAEALGADLALAATEIAPWSPPRGRGARETVRLDPVRENCGLTLIDDAFNANPASMAAGLEVLAASAPTGTGRRIAVLGDMAELGAGEARMHRDIAALASIAAIDLVHCAGPRMHGTWAALPPEKRGQWVRDADALAARMRGLIQPGDVILVKGSKSSHVSRVVDAIRKMGHPQLTDASETT